MLHDPEKMRHENIADGYDLFSGKVTSPITQYNEIHTGDLWQEARDYYCGSDLNAFPLALVCFYDKTHTDLHGSLSCAPFIATFSFFNEKCRNNDKFYSVLGYIPNLGYGLSKSNNKKPRDKLQDEHNCLKLITNQIIALNRQGGFQTYILGKLVTVKTWIHFIAGDTSGHNNLVGQYNSSNAAQPYRDCHCSLLELSDSVANCELITRDQYTLAKTSGILKEYSIHDINNAFDDVPFGDRQHGIFGCIPAEMLHVSGNGIMKYQLEIVNSIVGYGKNSKNKLHKLDVLHHNLVHDATRQSERDLPRMSARNGVTDGTKMSASERVGNMFMLLCAIHTNDGASLFEDGLKNINIAADQLVDCMKLQLSFEKWVNDSNNIDDVHGAVDVLKVLIESIQTCFPRDDANGWHIPKMHSLAKMIHYVRKFGKAKNFSGQIGERLLKSIVKDHAKQTQRRVSAFASQCAEREFETQVYDFAFNDVKHYFGENYQSQLNNDNDATVLRGLYTVLFDQCDNRGRGNVLIRWGDTTRRNISVSIHDMFKYAIRAFATAHGYYNQFEVKGYTSARLTLPNYEEPVIFYANNYLYGEERYHFCMVQFKDDVNGIETYKTCPAQILGFFTYNTVGIPTPYYINSGATQTDIAQNQLRDTNVYAIIHTASSYIPWETIEQNFIVPFVLGDLATCVYIVDVENITDPLFVFQNYGKDGSNYFCTLPFRRWGCYFKNRL
jgi:hypothetical protein